MAHKPFNLYKRPARNAKHIYYVQFYDDSGIRLGAKSTGQTSKAAAESWAYEQLKNGRIITKKNVTFGQYAREWWVWDRCSYIKSRCARGASISRGYADARRTYLDRHILPYFSNIRLQKITPDIIENWLMDLRGKPRRNGTPLSATTVNHCLKTLKIMLKEALRKGYIGSNPSQLIGTLREKPKEKSILTQNEVKELFRENRIDEIWTGDLRVGEGPPLFSPDSKHVAYTAVIDKKWVVVVDGKERARYEGIGEDTPIFSPDSKHFAYTAGADNKLFVVVDGKEGKRYDSIGKSGPIFSPNGNRVAYLAQVGNKWLVVVDEEEGWKYEGIVAGTLIFSTDSKWVVYAMGIDNMRFVVVDGTEGRKFDDIVTLAGGKIVFESFDRLHYLARRQNKIYLVHETIE